MLNRSKLLQELQTLSDSLFVDYSREYDRARHVFKKIARDSVFKAKVQATATSLLVPQWDGNLDEVIPVERWPKPYHVFSVDGSQIYPDRHQGNSCFLINIGTVKLRYGTDKKPVELNSVPRVFTGNEQELMQDFSVDGINCLREQFEFDASVQLCKNIQNKKDPLLFLFDGSLIFWHLESKEPEVKQFFASKYCNSLQKLYEQQILHAGYISLSKSKELVNLIRLALCNFQVEGCEESKTVDCLVDTSIAHFFLTPGTRSTIFKNQSKITALYPQDIKPYYFYLHVGHEVARIEIPAWIAYDEHKVNTVAALILDQVEKGRGYPVALAEAHEQAVVKGPDREFFYQVLNKIGVEHKQRLMPSQKSIKKRGIGI